MVNRTLREVKLEYLVTTVMDPSSPVSVPPRPPAYWDRLVQLLEHNVVICKCPGYGASIATPARYLPAAKARASFLLELNMYGRRALMPGGDIPSGCWPAVLSRIVSGVGVGGCSSSNKNGNDPPCGKPVAWSPSAVMYHFLRTKSELICTCDDPTKKRARRNTESSTTRVNRPNRRRRG